jgi:hypothetical protein
LHWAFFCGTFAKMFNPPGICIAGGIRREPGMDPTRKSYFESLGGRAVAALQKRGFRAVYAETRAEAREILLNEIPRDASIGVAGSVTLRELDILDALRERGQKILDHWTIPAGPENFEVRRAQQTCDLFLSSTNALTTEGQIVNIDGAGNRVNALAFGPRRAVIVAGINKVVSDLEAALRRIKEVAVPLNCRRMNAAPPCVAAGKCVDCRVPQRICRITSIIEWKPPFFSDYLVVIVGENLGY